jgi:hypothetical protein
MAQITRLHLRIPCTDLAALQRLLIIRLTDHFSVRNQEIQVPFGGRFCVDAISRRSECGRFVALAPRAVVAVRPHLGTTAQVLVCHQSGEDRVQQAVKEHADRVSVAILSILEQPRAESGSAMGHWLSSCGWYLELKGSTFRSERHLAKMGCTCGGCWLEISNGEFIQENSAIGLRPRDRKASWFPSVTLIGRHANKPMCDLCADSQGVPPLTEFEAAQLRYGPGLVACLPGRQIEFERI